MKIFVYSMRKYDELGYFEAFAKKYGVEFAYTTEYPSTDNYDLAKGFDAISIITTHTDSKMIDRMKSLGVKVISTRTIGYEHIDVDYAKKVGMGVCNVSYDPSGVADYTIMLMLMCCRKIQHILNASNNQDYRLEGKLGMDISKCTVGVIGTGRIGKTVIQHLSGFGCRILAYDINRNEDILQSGQADYVSLEKLYENSDIITLHVPGNNENYHLICDDAFEKMKDHVIIINCARGTLIDTTSLIKYLNSGKIGYAALDVLEDEKGLYYLDRRGEHLSNMGIAELKKFPNVFLLPHTAFYTEEAVSNMVEYSIVGALDYINGKDSPFHI